MYCSAVLTVHISFTIPIPQDRRLLVTILSRVYRPEILTDVPFKLSASGVYTVPPEGDHASYLSALDALPGLPLPEAFGLHDNADITKDLQQTQVGVLWVGGGARRALGTAQLCWKRTRPVAKTHKACSRDVCVVRACVCTIPCTHVPV